MEKESGTDVRRFPDISLQEKNEKKGKFGREKIRTYKTKSLLLIANSGSDLKEFEFIYLLGKIE